VRAGAFSHLLFVQIAKIHVVSLTKNKKRLLLKGNELLDGLDRTIKRRKRKK
jgi:hypothetical protein